MAQLSDRDGTYYHEGELAAFLTFVDCSLGELAASLTQVCMLLFFSSQLGRRPKRATIIS